MMQMKKTCIIKNIALDDVDEKTCIIKTSHLMKKYDVKKHIKKHCT